MPVKHTVIFAIDGLSETHSLYRIGTDYHQILHNAHAFIKAGGSAEWAFIRFKHNAHEVEAAKSVASELGFRSFVMKDSSRFVIDSKFPVLDKTGKIINFLEPAAESNIVFIKKSDIDNYKKVVNESDINCYAINTKEVYIDAFGKLFPCCWLASTPYNYTEPNSAISIVRQDIVDQYELLINDLGDIDTANRSVKDIINSEEYQSVWDKYWNDPKLITCARTCGVNKLSKPIDQFSNRETLNV